MTCVLLDLTMPGMNGAETLNRIRVIRPDLPVLLMSGYDSSGLTETLTASPHTGFLHKPFAPEDLVSKISTLINAAKGPAT